MIPVNSNYFLFDYFRIKEYIYDIALTGLFLKETKFYKYMSKIIDYLKETKAELKDVNWPTRMQTIYHTVIVVVLSLVIAYLLGFFDFIFSKGLGRIISF